MSILKIKVEDFVKEKVYQHVMSEYWNRIEKLKQEMHREVEREAARFARMVAKDILKDLKKK